MDALRDLLPALGQGLAGASASRDPYSVAAADSAANYVKFQEMVNAGLGIPALMGGNPNPTYNSLDRMQALPRVTGRMKLHIPLEVNPVLATAPAAAAGLMSYLHGDDPAHSIGAAAGHFGGATLADALIRGLAGKGVSRTSLAGGRILGALAGQAAGRYAVDSAGDSAGGSDELAYR